LRNWPTPLVIPFWSETPSLDSAACCLGLPWSPQIRPAFRSVPSAGTRIRWLRAGATRLTNGATDCPAFFAARKLARLSLQIRAPVLRGRGCSHRRKNQQTRQSERWLRGSVGMKQCFRDITQHTLSVWSVNAVRKDLPHKFFSCRQLPASGTLRHGIYVRQCAVVCCPAASLSRQLLSSSPLGTLLPSSRGSHRASSQASFTPTEPLRLE
jgi:hypothetical protein